MSRAAKRRGAWRALLAGLAGLVCMALGACPSLPVREEPLEARGSAGHRARVLEALGESDAAWEGWLAAPPDRWSAVRLAGLVDRVSGAALGPEALVRLERGGAAWRAVAVAVAERLGDMAAAARLRFAQGVVFGARRSGRLGRWPGAMPWGARAAGEAGGAAVYGERFEVRAGELASPEEGPGLYGFWVSPPGDAPGTYEVVIRAEGAVRAYVGGREVASNPRDTRLGPEVTRVTAELGPARPLEVQVLTTGSVARATIAVGPAVATDATDAAGDPPDPIAALEVALADDDMDAADRARANLGHDALGELVRAEALVADATRPVAAARGEARQALEALVAAHPELAEARARLGLLLLADGDEAEARRVLASGEANDAWRAEALAMLAEQSGDPIALAELAATWRVRAPRSCLAAGWAVTAAWEQLGADLAPLEALALQLPATRGACLESAFRAVERLRDARRLEGAAAALGRLAATLDPGPERARAELLAAEVALGRGGYAEAEAHAARALADGGVRAAALELFARVRRLQQKPVLGARDAGWTLLRRALDPATDLGLPLADARAAILAALAKHGSQGEAAETIRDDRFVRILPDGGQIIRTHTIMRLVSPEAVGTLGELALPEGAEVLVARTWKVGGAPGHPSVRPLEPEDIGAKATISFPAVTGGDVVEWAYFRYVPPDPRVAPGWTLTHTFDAETGPVAVARLVVSVAPPAKSAWRLRDAGPDAGASTPSFVADARLPPPARPDPETWVFEARQLPRYVPEALDPRPDLRALVLHAWSGVSERSWGEAARAELTPLALVTPAVRAFVADALAAASLESDSARDERPGLARDDSDTRRLEALQRHLDRRITPEDVPLVASNASHVAVLGRGERTLLFWAACRALGLACDLALARPLSDGPPPAAPPEGWPDPEGFSYPLVRVNVDHKTRWFDPGARFQPFATLLPNLEGVDALALADAGVETVRTTGSAALGPDGGAHGLRETAIELAVAADGKAFVATGSERLTGLYGAAWRTSLVALSPVEREQTLAHIVQSRLPDATLPEIQIEGLDDPSAPLVWRFKARGTAPMARHRARILVGLAPEGIARATIVLSERKTPLFVNRSVDSVTTLVVTLPRGLQFAPPPADVQVAHPSLVFERQSTLTTSDTARTLRMVKRLHVRPAIIAPTDYGAWIRAAIPADRGEVVELGWGAGLEP